MCSSDLARHKSGLGNTGDAGAVSVDNADGWKAIELRTRPNSEQDEEHEQSPSMCEAKRDQHFAPTPPHDPDFDKPSQ